MHIEAAHGVKAVQCILIQHEREVLRVELGVAQVEHDERFVYVGQSIHFKRAGQVAVARPDIHLIELEFADAAGEVAFTAAAP